MRSKDITKPTAMRLEEGKAYRFDAEGGSIGCVRVLVTSEETNGAYTFTYDEYEKGFFTDPHLHRDHDETFSILEGTMEWHIGGATYSATPGTMIWIPRGMPHNFRAPVPVKVHMIWSPGGVETAFEEYVSLTSEEKEDKERMKAYGEKHDVIGV